MVIMCGAACRGAADLLRALSDLLKALDGLQRSALDGRSRHDRLQSGLPCRTGMRSVTDYPYSNFTPRRK